MKRISFNRQFVNEKGDGLIENKIHTLRQNYEYWKKFEGKELALFYWNGKPRHSNQKVFCVKKLISVQEVEFKYNGLMRWFEVGSFNTTDGLFKINGINITDELFRNDGFEKEIDFIKWFENYKPGKMAILHFTDFRY